MPELTFTCGMFCFNPASGPLNSGGGRQVQDAGQRSSGCHGNNASKLKPSPNDSAVLICTACYGAHHRRHERLKVAAQSVPPPPLLLSPTSLRTVSLVSPTPPVIPQLASSRVNQLAVRPQRLSVGVPTTEDMHQLASPRVIELAVRPPRLSVGVPTTEDIWDALGSGRQVFAKSLLVRRHAANLRVLRVKRARATRPACLCGRACLHLSFSAHPRTRAPALVRSSSAELVCTQVFARGAGEARLP